MAMTNDDKKAAFMTAGLLVVLLAIFGGISITTKQWEPVLVMLGLYAFGGLLIFVLWALALIAGRIWK